MPDWFYQTVTQPLFFRMPAVRGRNFALGFLGRLARLPLGPQHSLHLVRIGGASLLVACSPSGCALLQTLPADAAAASPEAAR